MRSGGGGGGAYCLVLISVALLPLTMGNPGVHMIGTGVSLGMTSVISYICGWVGGLCGHVGGEIW